MRAVTYRIRPERFACTVLDDGSRRYEDGAPTPHAADQSFARLHADHGL
jgi:hypothetical protein